jgi:hypothetical protein
MLKVGPRTRQNIQNCVALDVSAADVAACGSTAYEQGEGLAKFVAAVRFWWPGQRHKQELAVAAYSYCAQYALPYE